MKRIGRHLATLLGLVILLGGCARWEIDRMRALDTRVRQQRENGQLDQALITAETMVKTRPDHHLAWWTLASVHQDRGEYGKAERAIRTAIEVAPDSALPSLHAFLGANYHSAALYSEAAQQYEKTLELAPEYPHILPVLADALILAGKLEEAEETVDRALQEEPAHPFTYVAAGQLHYDRDEPEAAIEAWQRALELDPRCFDARRSLGLVLSERGRHEEAVEQLEKALEIHPDDFWSQASLGHALRRTGRYEEAAERLEAAHRLDSSDAGTFGALVDTLLRLGEVDRALDVTSGAAADLPEEYAPLVGAVRALALTHAGEVEAARRSLAGIDSDGVPEPWVHSFVALARMHIGDMERAQAAWWDGAWADASDPGMWVGSAMTAALQGDTEQVREDVAAVRDDFGRGDAGLTAAYALALARGGEMAAAREELVWLEEEDWPGDYEWIHELYLAGLAYRELGETERSSALFQRSIDRWPKHPWSEKMREMMQ